MDLVEQRVESSCISYIRGYKRAMAWPVDIVPSSLLRFTNLHETGVPGIHHCFPRATPTSASLSRSYYSRWVGAVPVAYLVRLVLSRLTILARTD